MQKLLTATLLTALLAPASVHAADTPPTAKPNVIVILADDYGWRD